MASASAPAQALKQRLLQDIAELQTNPYPNVELYVDEDLTKACLILTVNGYGPIHMTVEFPATYPLDPPRIQMNSNIQHPNIFGSYICASILNTTEGYTPAYTLKGVAIQMLSFFGSEKLEQSGGHYSVDINNYRTNQSHIRQTFVCNKCQYGTPNASASGSRSSSRSTAATTPPPVSGADAEIHWPTPQQSTPVILGRNARRRKVREAAEARARLSQNTESTVTVAPAVTPPKVVKPPKNIQDMQIPDELLLKICNYLDTEDVMVFAAAWDRIGTMMTNFDVIRTRELQCFCFKKDFLSAKLGVGVNIETRGKGVGSFESEFDLLSQEAFGQHDIRRAVHGRTFGNWLPLPISNGHWRKVRDIVKDSLTKLGSGANIGHLPRVEVIYSFMNNVVVKLNQEVSEPMSTRRRHYDFYSDHGGNSSNPKSSLTHASEKAIESYFHLFHLLLCLATEDPSIVQSANETLRAFGRGASSKAACPNLGALLVSALISDVDMSDAMIKSIIKETITRNVVWMLDSRGANMPELAYLEPSTVSEYRLQETFEASKTSYRLLMFLNLFRKTAVGSPRKPLAQLRDEAFERHGAPPRGSAKGLADSIKRIHLVSNFPDFLLNMGVGKPSAQWFTSFLKECMQASINKGYSRMPIRQGQALALRQLKEPRVSVAARLEPEPVEMRGISFFPTMRDRGGRGGRR